MWKWWIKEKVNSLCETSAGKEVGEDCQGPVMTGVGDFPAVVSYDISYPIFRLNESLVSGTATLLTRRVKNINVL